MSLPPCFAGPDQRDAALPLLLVDRTGYDGWRARQGEPVQAWLDAHGFRPQVGAPLLVPGANGRPAFALAGIADATDPLALSHLPALLPEGTYRLSPDSPVAVDPGRALLGWGLGAYRFERYVKSPRPPARLVLESADADASEAWTLLKASTLVRDLVNTPTEHMGPQELEAVAVRIAAAYGGRVESIAGEALLQRNFPAIHAVGRASHRAPRLITLDWGDDAHPRLAIVGKGVCFDTGGLDIKPADGMRNMKKDMGGAAHALALAQLVMARRLPVRLQLLLPAVENVIGPDAFRPGEVLSTRQGLSVEVDNTDAEGRLVLCDALAHAVEGRPALLVDFATLTGAARVALGPDLPPLFANDDGLAEAMLAGGIERDDPLWRMPLWDAYADLLETDIADLGNAGSSAFAGTITAALFLKRFVGEGIAWAHIDTFAWRPSAKHGRPKGGAALGLRATWAMLQSRYDRRRKSDAS